MTDIKKIDVSTHIGATPKFQLEKLAEAVNMLQGVTDDDQRATRKFEFEQRLAAVEARLKNAGV